MKTKNIILLYLIIPIVYITIHFFNKDYQISLTEEDGAFENMSVIAYLFASIIFFYIYFKYKNESYKFFGKSTKRNVYFVLLAILFFVIIGEEISWGQRIFNWNTPGGLKEINAQKETNFHNLWLFQAYNLDGTQKTFLEKMLNMNRLLSVFWMMFCVLIPIWSSVSKKGKKIIAYLGIPIVPLWIGGFFVLNYVVFIIYHYTHTANFLDDEEVKESFYAIGFALLGFHFLKKKKESI